MIINIYGLVGHAGRYQMPMDELEVSDLETGEEFIFNGRVYEIRSVHHMDDMVFINVNLMVHHAVG